jgi:DNA-binding NarL/FixJ family response regulator
VSHPRIRVLLADDHAIILEGLRALLEGERDIEVVAATTDAGRVSPLAREHRPDVVVLDLQLAGAGGTEVLAALRDEVPAAKVLVLTAYDDGESVRSALDAGADGLAFKTESPQQTIAAIRDVSAGRIVFPHSARRWLQRPGPAAGGLTLRERQVGALVSAGLTNPEIAARLGLSCNTVKFHVHHLLAKLGAANRTEAAVRLAAVDPAGGRPAPGRGR